MDLHVEARRFRNFVASHTEVILREGGVDDRSYKKFMSERHGLKPHREHWDSTCPMRVVGQPCKSSRDSDVQCICDKHGYPLMDHCHLWYRGDDLVLTSESYRVSGTDVAALTADLSPLGLELCIRADGGYYPGNATLIIIKCETSATPDRENDLIFPQE